jgi:hypothetical protein
VNLSSWSIARRKHVVSADSGSAQITVYPALDDGFAPPKQFFVGPQPFDLAAGELDGDGRTDLIVAVFGDSTLAVMLTGA